MKYFINYATAAAITAGMITFASPRIAFGELVFDEDLNTAEADQTVAKDRAEERKELTKSEMLRRQRLREELKNEDMLTQKLEELRLKDEMKRTDKILGSGVEKQDTTAQEAPNAMLTEQRVGLAATEMPAPTIVQTSASQPISSGAAVAPVSTAEVSAPSEEEEFANRVTITPRGGTSSIINPAYDVSARYSLGFSLSVDITDHIAFAGGYSYSSYKVGPGGALVTPTGYNYNFQQLTLNDNVIDVGARGYILGLKSRARPYVGAGLGYRKGYINYNDGDERVKAWRRQYDANSSRDVEISGFSGYLETGLDIRITKAISFTAGFRYFNILTSQQSNPISPYAFASPYGYSGGYGAGYYPALNYDSRVNAGSALAKNNFYQGLLGVSVSF